MNRDIESRPDAAIPGRAVTSPDVEERAAGVLLAVSSLPSPYGIGALGAEARAFIDFLERSGQRYWQILPLGTTGLGDSPYQNFSIQAGNPYLIDLSELVREGILTQDALHVLDFGSDPERVDYSLLWQNRGTILRWAWETFQYGQFSALEADFQDFRRAQKDWLDDYVLFMTIKEAENGKAWRDWPNALKKREKTALQDFHAAHENRIAYHAFVQFLFYRQWESLRRYAGERGVRIFGDVPIYLPEDCVEVWREPELFQLDEALNPIAVAGCPPDYYNPEGQLWGNVLYDWERMANDDYAWWVRRVRWALSVYDVLRIDHFRGFSSYWAVPYGAKTADRGAWCSGPGAAFFEALKTQCSPLRVIAEDLGFISGEVRALREAAGFPGMKVLQFAFSPNADSVYLPHNLERNSVIYPGTHDSDTIMGWFADTATEDEISFAKKYLGLSKEEGWHWGMIRGAMTSISRLSIVSMQDYLGLDNRARMNRPGEPWGNWTWRLKPGSLTEELSMRMRELTRISGRLAPMPV